MATKNKELIQQVVGVKAFRKRLYMGEKDIINLTDKAGNIYQTRTDVKTFYVNLYSSVTTECTHYPRDFLDFHKAFDIIEIGALPNVS